MDSEGQAYEMLDLLAYHCNDLSRQLKETPDQENVILHDYLVKVSEEFEPIDEFADEMDWFNVNEALLLHGQLKGKIVVLDFFTYCCINCMHILPDLKKLEEQRPISDGLVVIGVHSPKFDNEKSSANILSAIQRYNITHPVVNDAKTIMWTNLQIKCWPTILILGPNGNPIFVLMGEGHSELFTKYVDAAFEFYKPKGLLRNHALPISLASELTKPTILQFPGKISSRLLTKSKPNEDEVDTPTQLYAITDSGNHRIIIFREDGRIVRIIGGKESGFADGSFDVARFNSPQGITFFTDDILYVADTENHAIREINLYTKNVDTIAGHGKQGVDQLGGSIGITQSISSPWDVCIFRTPDMDMSFHPDDEDIPDKHVILIAMAGTHQIWAIFKSEMIWWRFKKCAEGTCIAIAGSGSEENRNNSYPMSAGFAQPSGLALSEKYKELYVADSESSSIRKLSLADGKVSAVAGGDRNPMNLFEFGDKDGAQLKAKFQHPLGVAYDTIKHQLYVADSYNHKIKLIELPTNNVTTCDFKDAQGNAIVLKEPSAVCMSPCNKYLYICNTNNHTIEVIDLNTSIGHTLDLRIDDETKPKPARSLPPFKILTTPEILIHEDGAKITLELNVMAGNGSKFTDAPQNWKMTFSDQSWTTKQLAGTFVKSRAPLNPEICTKLSTTIEIDAYNATNANNSMEISYKLSLCADTKGICFPKFFNMIVPTKYGTGGLAEVNHSANIYVDLQRIEWEAELEK